jgi:hypothetical protein
MGEFILCDYVENTKDPNIKRNKQHERTDYICRDIENESICGNTSEFNITHELLFVITVIGFWFSIRHY